MEAVYGVSMPADVRALLERLTVIVSLGMGSVATTPLECLGLGGYVPRLVFWMLFPLVVTAVILCGVGASMLLKRLRLGSKAHAVTVSENKKQSKSHGGKMVDMDMLSRLDAEPEVGSTLVENALPPFLQVMFLLYPLVTNVAFEGFPCYQFEGGRAWLIADVSIECGTAEAASAVQLAWIAVIVYPIGLMVGNLALLIMARNAIIDGKHTPLSRSIEFLYSEYEVSTIFQHCWDLQGTLECACCISTDRATCLYIAASTGHNILVGNCRDVA